MRKWPALAVLLFLTASCASEGDARLSEEQVCQNHHENNPAERDRCTLDAGRRSGSPPQARPQDLPVRTGQPSD